MDIFQQVLVPYLGGLSDLCETMRFLPPAFLLAAGCVKAFDNSRYDNVSVLSFLGSQKVNMRRSLCEPMSLNSLGSSS